jgi:hypothetical protein
MASFNSVTYRRVSRESPEAIALTSLRGIPRPRPYRSRGLAMSLGSRDSSRPITVTTSNSDPTANDARANNTPLIRRGLLVSGSSGMADAWLG